MYMFVLVGKFPYFIEYKSFLFLRVVYWATWYSKNLLYCTVNIWSSAFLFGTSSISIVLYFWLVDLCYYLFFPLWFFAILLLLLFVVTAAFFIFFWTDDLSEIIFLPSENRGKVCINTTLLRPTYDITLGLVLLLLYRRRRMKRRWLKVLKWKLGEA